MALAALFGLVSGGDFGDRFRVGLWIDGCLLVLFGRMMSGHDEPISGPRVSTAAVFALAALAVFALAIVSEL